MVTGTFQWAKGPIGTFHNCDLCYYIENSEETVAKLGKFGLRQKQNKATVTFDECFNRTRNEKKQECNINVEGRVSYNFTTEVNELHSLQMKLFRENVDYLFVQLLEISFIKYGMYDES